MLLAVRLRCGFYGSKIGYSGSSIRTACEWLASTAHAHAGNGGCGRCGCGFQYSFDSFFTPTFGRCFNSRQCPAHVGQFLWRKDTHSAVFAVITALAVDLPTPHAGHSLAKRFPVGANVGLWQAAKNIQLWPQFTQQAAVAFLHTA